MKRLNLDANATFGLHPEVAAALAEMLPRFKNEILNPSSVHQGGQAARLILDDARDEIRLLCGAEANDLVIFTSGATEANNQAIVAPFLSLLAGKVNPSQFALLTSCVEHESVMEAASRVASLGFTVRRVVPATSESWFQTSDFTAAIDPAIKVISLIHGQNEIGTLLPIADISVSARALIPQVFIHSDAVQTFGRVPFSLKNLGVDAISISAHKIGGLSGVGALVVRHGSAGLISQLLVGGAQEGRMRAGTENILGIYSFGVAARLARLDTERADRMKRNRNALRTMLLESNPKIVIQGEQAEYLPNTLCITLPLESLRGDDLRGDDLVVALDMQGVCISTGSACSSGRQEGIRTLRALGFSESEVQRSVRISLTGSESIEQLQFVSNAIFQALRRVSAIKSTKNSSEIRELEAGAVLS